MESGILLAMALDCYIAICDPLRHTSILTPSILGRMMVIVAIRATVLVGLLPILIKRLHCFHSTVIAHSYCEHMGIVKLACASIWINAIYGLFVASFLILDVHWLEFLMPTSSMQFSISHLEMFATKP